MWTNYFFQALKGKKKKRGKKNHASITLTVVRDRKIRTALRTNKTAGFVTMPAWKKINNIKLYFIKINLFTYLLDEGGRVHDCNDVILYQTLVTVLFHHNSKHREER